ncbi:T9SS type B sorting domain-containing protein [Flavobacterium sp. DGU11]|uniref:T9SS type B sorting domain-containing protein n=1 Tax=Flavobacterium arundinis TaxID=3139143 RepID=A0ABU9HX56_9FLAO
MLQKYKRQAALLPFLQFFFVLLSGYGAHAQIYQHNFGTTTISTHPYAAAPSTLAANLSGSSWTNSTSAWSSNTGSAGQAIQYFNTPGTTTVTLTFNVAPNFQVGVTSFNFWRQRSASGPQAWQMSINGINVGSGTTPLSGNGTGAAIGVTPVANPVSGLTGTVTVVLTLSGATGAGNIRFDDFTLNGSVTSTCTNAVVTSYSPHSGPKDTMITITGSGFTDTSTVKIDGITMPFTIISDTEIQAMVPAGVTSGNITVTATDGCFGQGGIPFTLIESDCVSPEIYISEIFDQAAGDPGFVEIYNPSSTPVTLDGVYVIERYGEIVDTTPSNNYIISLSGTIPPTSTYLISCGSSTPLLCTPYNPTFLASMGGINDNDKFRLKKNGAIIDEVQIPFGVGTGPTHRGYTMIRKPNAVAPAVTFNLNDWIADNNEYCTNIGMHTANSTSIPLPLITHPAPRTVCVNTNTTFTATIIPSTGFTYQWKMLTSAGTWVNVTNNGTYSGATTATLSVNGVSIAMNNSQYYLEATSASCVIRTDAAQLFVLDKPAAPTVTVTQPTCSTPTGSITITGPPDPDNNFTYSINGVNYVTGTTFNNLTPGTTYNITVRNIAGCTSNITTQAINTVPGAPVAPTLTAVQPDCTNANGSITVTWPVGAGYTYSIDGGPYVAATTFSPVAPGPHNITAQLAGCTSPATAQTIDAQPVTPAVPTLTVTQPTCTVPGSITVDTPIGIDYSYSIDGGPYQAGTLFNPVAPGPHNITAKLGNCISAQAPVTIDPVPGAPAAPTLTAVQPDCATATGSITVTNPVGPDYSYSIDGLAYQSGTTFSPVSPGPHTITVKLNDCISAPASQTINIQPATPATPTLSAVQPDCTTATGSITITNPGGTGYTYSIDGLAPQSGTTFTLVASGPHTITAQANGCTSPPASITIDAQPATPAAPALTAVQPTCSTATGSIMIDNAVTGYTYSLDGAPFQAGTTFTDVAQGPHNVIAKLGSCVSAPGSITINVQPATPPAPTVTAVQPTCTTPTGSITVTNPMPGPGYTYSIDGLPPQSSATFSPVATGPHTITVTLNGCTSAATSQTIDQQPETPAVPTFTAVQPDCTTPTGTITVDTPVGAGYTYSIDGNPYQASTIFTVAAGPHNVTAKLGACISAPGSITIDAQPATPTVPTFTVVQPDCTTATGSITVTNPVGAGYTYSIDGLPFQSFTTFNTVLPGPHNVIAKLGNCTSAPGSITIDTQPATPAAPTLSAVQPSCGVPTGSITVTSSGANYTYNIDGGIFQSGITFTNVAPGPHTITAKNTSGCVSPGASITIDPALIVPAAPTLSVVQTTCTTGTGTITVTTPVGAGITYSIDGLPYQTSATFNTVAPGPHTITVKNASGCVSPVATRTIDPQPATPVAPTLTAVQPSCGVPTGSITVTNPAGLSYSIDGGAFQSSPTFTSVLPGNHIITVKNTAGCVSPGTSQTINPALAVPAQPTVTAVQTTCTVITGSITVTAPLGADLTYSIDGGTFQLGTTFLNVLPGPHTITVKNGAGCVSLPRTQTINPVPTAPDVALLSVSHPGCNATKGSIAVTSPIGTGYSYSIDGEPYQTGTSFANLYPGTHTIIVKNAAGCLSSPASETINIPPATPDAPVVTIVQPDCTTATGSITVTYPVGGGLMYSVNSLTYQSEVDFNSLAPGNYVITARNTSGCVSGYTHFVINYPPLVPAVPVVNVVQPNCDKPTGTITVSSPVGFGLEYSTDGTNFQPSRIFNGVLPGTYTVTVRNSAGCSAFLAGITVDPAPAPAPFPGVITGDTAVCEGGTIQLANTVTTGAWSSSNTDVATVDSNGLVTTLKPGTVTIMYTTGTVCTAAATHVITINALPDPQLRDTYLCVDNETGLPVTGVLNSGLSATAYDFTWTKGTTPLTATTSAIIVTEPGDYTVTATNKITGCVGTSTATVGLSSIALGYAEATVDFQYNQMITVHITGGSGDYEYSLDGGPYQDENYFTGIYEGEYHVTVRDKHGCGELELVVYALNYPRFFSPNGDGARDTWNIKGLRGQPDAKIFIFDRYGKLIAGLKPGGPGWDGTYNGERLPATDYWFTLQYHGANGEGKEFRAHFSLLR